MPATKPVTRPYPVEFTELVSGVVDTALKAIIQPNPVQFIQDHAVAGAQDVKRLRDGIYPAQRLEPEVSAAWKSDLIRIRAVRDLAIDLVEAFERIELAKRLELGSQADSRVQ